MIKEPAQIISASRRTDIPAYFGEWFLQQVKNGCTDVPNPFSKKLYHVSLLPEHVSAIVFWSKDYHPFIPVVNKIDTLYDCRFLFQFTINGFNNNAKTLLEPHSPESLISIEMAKFLSEKYGCEKVIWRFDPIILSNLTPVDERIHAFEYLAVNLKGVVRRCFTSFVDLYGKVRQRFADLEKRSEIRFYLPGFLEQTELLKALNKIAQRNQIEIFSCCEDKIAEAASIQKGHCIDTQLLVRLYPEMKFTNQIKPTRKGCGCYASTDIGTYNSCRYQCVYCYATK